MGRLDTKLVIENRIPLLRAERGITQEELAHAVGVTRATIIAIEKGGYNPSLELAFRLAKFFRVSISRLFFEKEKTSD